MMGLKPQMTPMTQIMNPYPSIHFICGIRDICG